MQKVKINTVSSLLVTAALLAGAATAASAAPSANAKARTCAAVAAWERHPSGGRLDAMMSASFGVPWKYLGEDADGLYRDVRGGKTKYIASDERYLREDCR